MFKFILIPFKVLLVFLISSYFTSGLTIEQDAPDRIDSLGTCTVNLTVKTGGVAGFAKLQYRFPEGVEVEPVELHGATFSFQNRQMKVIWMNLPEEKEFTVSYKLKVTSGDVVELPLGGTFSYLEENKRMTYDIEQKIMKVGPDHETIKERQRPRVLVNRHFERMGDHRYKVTLTVESRFVSGFAKIEDTVPFDAAASAVETAESVFSQVDNRIKFVWMSLPEADTFSVSYNLDLSNAVSQNLDEIEGKFSFLFENETQKIDIEPGEISIPLDEEQPAQDEPAEEEEPVLAAEEEPKKDESPQPEIAQLAEDEIEQPDTQVKKQPREKEEIPVEKVLAANEKIEAEEAPVPTSKKTKKAEESPKPDVKDVTASSTTTTTPSASGADEGVEYRVQILAGKNSVNAPYFKEKHNYEGNFFVENHEGWVKYTTGGYGVYGSARDAREQIRGSYNFPGPFVVAYNDGMRITVQEALMVTSQKWIK